MHWPQGPLGRLDARIPRERRHEPFTPQVPAFISDRPAVSGALMAVGGFSANWWIGTQMPGWPAWMILPGAIVAILCLFTMMIGLGLVVVRALEPVIARMDLDWDAEPLAALGIPLPLQRKCESLGFWSAEDLVNAVDHGTFPWTKLEYDERMQVERAAQRWSVAVRAEKAAKKARRRGRKDAAQQSGD